MINFNNSTFIKSAPNGKDVPEKILPAVLFVGKSNVGKSSLINSICKQKHLAKTSNTPGATKLLNFFQCDSKYYLIDAPGYGFVKNSQNNFSKMMEDIFAYPKLQGVIFLLDARRKLTDNDKVFYNSLIDHNLPFFIVLTKSDKIDQSQKILIKKEVLKFFVVVQESEIIFTSSLNGQNLDKLKDKIEYLLKYKK